MKAIRLREIGEPEKLVLEEVPIPTPGARQVLVRVAACGVNYADTNVRRGRYVAQPPLPFVMGFEIAGRVEALGPDVDAARLPIGTRVCATSFAGGGYAELTAVDEASAIQLPDGVTFEAGAAFPVQVPTAHHVLFTMGRLAAGETVLVHAAAGGVGTIAVQLASAAGARVIAVAGGAEKARLAAELGAAVTIDHQREDFAARVAEVTGGRGVDLVLESIGGQVREQSFGCLAPLGRLVAFGEASGVLPDLAAVWPAIRRRSLSLIGFHLSAVAAGAAHRDACARLLSEIARGSLRVVVGRTFPLADAAAAHAALEARSTTGKVLLLTGAA